ncbi:hypothetical protein IL095_002279 [Enterococcus hirae]|nr:hypothetical protein [Enterococcus hirae]
MKLHVHLDEKKYTTKPSEQEIKTSLNERITEKIIELDIKDLAQEVGLEGRSVVFGNFPPHERQSAKLISQKIVALDFDNTKIEIINGEKTKVQTTGNDYFTINQALANDFIRTYASFLYETFSSTEDWNRFRVIFVLSEAQENRHSIKNIYKSLMNIFPQADRSPQDASRIFFGGNSNLIEIDYENVLPTDILALNTEHTDSKIAKIPSYVEISDDLQRENYKRPTYKLIKDGTLESWQEVQKRWQSLKLNTVSFPTITNATEAINYLPMNVLFDLPSESFHDIFSTDKSPSANVWKSQSGVWLYTRFNQGLDGNKTYNNLGLLRNLLGSGNIPASFDTALNFAINHLGLLIEELDEFKNIKDSVQTFKSILLEADLKETHPDLYKLFGKYRYQSEVNAILDVFLMNIYKDENGEIRCLNYYSLNTLANKIGSNKRKVEKITNLMTVTGIIRKLPDQDIPSKLLGQLKKNQTHFTIHGNTEQRNRKRSRRSSVFELLNLMENFSKIEERSELLTKKGLTTKGLNREWIEKNINSKIADEVFPQDTDRHVSIDTLNFEKTLITYALEQINKHGFVMVKKLHSYMHNKGYSKTFTDTKIKFALNDILDGYNLKRIRLTKALKKELNILGSSITSSPSILVPNKN